MLGAAAVMAMAVSSCKAGNTGSETTAETASASVSETVETAPAAETATNAVNLKADGIKVDTAGYKTTASGLMYIEVKAGKADGKTPTAEQTVKVHYTGKHLNGEVFDSSVERGEPIDFPLNRVIPGWTEGVQLMKEGAKYQFLIPSSLGYGPNGTPGGPIAPNEDLYFEVELLEVQ